VIVKIAKTAQPVGFCPYRSQQDVRVGITGFLIDTQNIRRLWVANKMRVKGLSVAGDTLESVQVGLKKIRSGAHLGENNKAFETGRHDLLHQIGFARRRLIGCHTAFHREVAHKMRMHPLILEVLQKLPKP